MKMSFIWLLSWWKLDEKWYYFNILNYDMEVNLKKKIQAIVPIQDYVYAFKTVGLRFCFKT